MAVLYMNNIDIPMNTTLYVVHLMTKKLQAQEHFKMDVGLAAFLAVF